MIGTSATYLAVRAVNGLLAIATLALLTRLLPPEQYGNFALGMATMTVLAAVLFQWLNAALARFHAAQAERENELLTTAHALFLRGAGVLVIGVVTWSIAGPVANISVAAASAIAFGAAALGLHNLHLQIVNSRGQPLRYGLITTSRGALALAIAAALIFLGGGATGALVAVGIACLLAIGAFGARWRWRTSADEALLRRQFAVFGLPVALTSLSTMVVDVADRFLLALWHGGAAVAGYAAAYDLTQQTVGVILNVFFLASYPRIAAAWECEGTAAARAAMVSLRQALLLAGPLVIGLFIGLAPDLASLMLGAGMRAEATKVIPIVAVAIGIGCLKAYLLDVAFHLTKTTSTLLRIAATMATFSILLNLILIPSLAYVGAGLALLAAFSLGAALSWWFGRPAGLYPGLGRELAKALIAVVLMVMALRLVNSVLPLEVSTSNRLAGLLKVIVGSTVFGVAAWLTDLSQLRSQMTKRLMRVPDSAP